MYDILNLNQSINQWSIHPRPQYWSQVIEPVVIVAAAAAVVVEMMEDPFIAEDDTHGCHKVEEHVPYCNEVRAEAEDGRHGSPSTRTIQMLGSSLSTVSAAYQKATNNHIELICCSWHRSIKRGRQGQK